MKPMAYARSGSRDHGVKNYSRQEVNREHKELGKLLWTNGSYAAGDRADSIKRLILPDPIRLPKILTQGQKNPKKEFVT